MLRSSAVAQRNALLARRLSAVELLEMHMARIAVLNPMLNAVVLHDFDAAFDAAHKADQALAAGLPPRPLHGIPMTIKESYDVKGYPTTWGMTGYRENRPSHTAPAVERLIEAGAIIIGKTNVAEALADWQTSNTVYGTTNNPWDLTRTPGGSSGGGAAAVASGMSPIELGSDIGGSLRNPAHYCGVMSHKPTYGVVPQCGETYPGTISPVDVSANGPIARSVADLRLVLDVIAGPAAPQCSAWTLQLPEAAAKSLCEYRVAVLRGDDEFRVSAEITEAIGTLAGYLAPRCASLIIDPPLVRRSGEIFDLGIALLRAATSSRLAEEEFERRCRMAPVLDAADRSYLARMTRGTTMLHRQWLQVNEARNLIRRAWQDYFARVDVLICPAAASTAPLHSHAVPRHERTLMIDGRTVPEAEQMFWAILAGMSYLPSTVVPIALSRDGLPIGVQVIAGEYRDRTCLRFAELLEREYRCFTPPPLAT